MRWSITFYETQTKQSDIFSIVSVICVRPFKLSLNSTVTKTCWLCYQNVTKLSSASVRMCDCKRLSAHNFVDFCLQTIPTTSEVLRCRSPSRCPPSSPVSHARRYADEMSYSRRSPSLRCTSLWATTTVAVECPTDLFVASHWLERSSSRFSVTCSLVFSQADHSTLHLVLTTFYEVLSPLFIQGLLQKPSSSSDFFWLVHGRDVTRRG